MLPHRWLADDGTLLTSAGPIPLDRPVRARDLSRLGVGRRQAHELREAGLIRRVTHGVYAAAQAPDSIRFRAAALALVVPEHAVVTDRTAAWLHGVPVLQRGAHLSAPPIDLCETIDSRSRRREVDGRRRQVRASDIQSIEGVQVTTPLRTALDLGRLLWRYDALAALDGFLRMGVDHDHLLCSIERFRGFRGVRQLRIYAPMADGRSESPGESALRLRWHEAGLPTPELQIWVYDERGSAKFRLDLGLSGIRLGVEYDGRDHHTSPADVAHDAARREWLREIGWTVAAVTADDVYGAGTSIEGELHQYVVTARRESSRWAP